jgi:hypothetical protein
MVFSVALSLRANTVDERSPDRDHFSGWIRLGRARESTASLRRRILGGLGVELVAYIVAWVACALVG